PNQPRRRGRKTWSGESPRCQCRKQGPGQRQNPGEMLQRALLCEERDEPWAEPMLESPERDDCEPCKRSADQNQELVRLARPRTGTDPRQRRLHEARGPCEEKTADRNRHRHAPFSEALTAQCNWIEGRSPDEPDPAVVVRRGVG